MDDKPALTQQELQDIRTRAYSLIDRVAHGENLPRREIRSHFGWDLAALLEHVEALEAALYELAAIPIDPTCPDDRQPYYTFGSLTVGDVRCARSLLPAQEWPVFTQAVSATSAA